MFDQIFYGIVSGIINLIVWTISTIVNLIKWSFNHERKVDIDVIGAYSHVYQNYVLPSVESARTRVCLEIRVPRDTEWSPDKVEQLMDSIFTCRLPVILYLKAAHGRLAWMVETEDSEIERVRSGIYATYPQAKVTEVKRPDGEGYKNYMLLGTYPFIKPIPDAYEFDHDPMAFLSNSLQQATDDESIHFTILFGELAPELKERGRLALSTPVHSWTSALNPAQFAQAEAEQLAGYGRAFHYDESTTRSAMEKLERPLRFINILIQVKAESETRSQTLVNSIVSSLGQFDEMFFVANDGYFLAFTSSELAAIWHPPTRECRAAGIQWAGSATSPAPESVRQSNYTQRGKSVDLVPDDLLEARPKDAIHIGDNVYQGQTRELYLPDSMRTAHVHVVGGTRMGKSTFLRNMIRQDIAQGKGVGVIDPHGDLVEEILHSPELEKRHQDVVLLDVSDLENPPGINVLYRPVSVVDDEVSTAAGYLVDAIRRIFEDDEHWSMGKMENVLYNSINALMSSEGTTIMDIPKFLLEDDFRSQILENVIDPVTRSFWTAEYARQSASDKLQTASPVSNRIQRFYRNAQLRRILCQQKGLDLPEIINNKKILLVNLSSLASMERDTLGSILIAQIKTAVLGRARFKERSPFYLYIDEVQNFVTTDLPTMMSEAGKYGLSLTIANQFLDQLEGNTLKAVMGNVGVTHIFRIGANDAKLLAEYLGDDITPAALTNIPQYETMTRIGGESVPFSVKTPSAYMDKVGENVVTEIRREASKPYTTPKDEVDAQIAAMLESPKKPEKFKPEPKRFHD